MDGPGGSDARQLHASQASVPGTASRNGNDVHRRPADTSRVAASRSTDRFSSPRIRRPDFRVDTTFAGRPPLAGATLRGVSERAVSVRRHDGPPPGALVADARTRTQHSCRRFARSIPRDVSVRLLPGPERRRRRPGRGRDRRRSTPTAASRRPSRPNATWTSPYRYTFEADVEDISRQHIANRSAVIVHPAPVVHRAAPADDFADAATGTSVDVVAVDPEGRCGRRVRRDRARSSASSGTRCAGRRAAASTPGTPNGSRCPPASGRSRRRPSR